jgi:hypothetical protein
MPGANFTKIRFVQLAAASIGPAREEMIYALGDDGQIYTIGNMPDPNVPGKLLYYWFPLEYPFGRDEAIKRSIAEFARRGGKPCPIR